MSIGPRTKAQALTHPIAVGRSKAASLLDLSPSTFDKWVRLGWMPEGIKIDGVRRWDAAEVKACWLDLAEKNVKPEEDDGENPLDHLVG